MRRLLFIFCTSAACSTFAYEPERARDNFAHEAVECSAYFMLISAVPGLEAGQVKGLRDKYAALLLLSVAMTSEKVTRARFELATKGMMRNLDGSWSNVSIVNNQYGYPCVDFVNDPEARMKFWLDKQG